jgi:glucose/mannose-6-phosphate isomerase
MLGNIGDLADQVRQTIADGAHFDFAPTREIYNVIITGMGGSALGADVILHLYADKLKKPLTLVRGYDLPAWVDENTLVIASSYSGNTEETVAAATQALEKKAQLVCISTGGKIEELALQNHCPFFKITPTYNPTNSPRMATGYSVTALLVILTKAGLINFTPDDAKAAELQILATDEKCRQSVPTADNPAKLLALEIIDRRPTLISTDFLEGALHIASNQLNESGKTLANYQIIPELNHHLMEGLQFPLGLASTSFFMLVQSSLAHPRNQKRLDLTAELLANKSFDHKIITLTAESKLTQVFELITMMSYTSYYLAILECVDPTPNPEVDWFKKALG